MDTQPGRRTRGDGPLRLVLDEKSDDRLRVDRAGAALPRILTTIAIVASMWLVAPVFAADVEFVTACKDAGVHILAAPNAPAHSIALDFSPRVRRDLNTHYGMKEDGHILMYGTSTGWGDWVPRRRGHTVFWEDRNTSAAAHNRPPYIRSRESGRNEPIDALTADVIVFADLSDPAELDKPVMNQGVVRYALTATDRRDGKLLGTMDYVVDMVNRRACGANTPGGIAMDTFMLQAAAIPIVIPEYELERRKRVLGK